MVCRLCFGRLDQARDLDTFQLARPKVSAKTSRLPVALDGDVQIMQTPLHYRSRPRALTVIVADDNRAGARVVASSRPLFETVDSLGP